MRPSRAGSAQPDKGLGKCVSEHGLDLCASGTGATLRAFGGTKGLLEKITLLGTDKGDWTVDVVR